MGPPLCASTGGRSRRSPAVPTRRGARRERTTVIGPRSQHHRTGGHVTRLAEGDRLPFEGASVRVGKGITVCYGEGTRIAVGWRHDDGRPKLFDRVEAPFPLAIWADDAIRGLVAGGVA